MKARLLLALLILIASAACQPKASTPTVDVPRVAAKQLATVYLPPTPDDAARAATQRVSAPTATVAPPTPTPSATPYVGVFIGELDQDSINPALNSPLSDTFRTPQAPTPAALDCEIVPDEAFGTVWYQTSGVVLGLGCPIQIMFAFQGNIQVFEHGVMYWREDTGEIWAITPGGYEIGQYWYVAEPPSLTTDEFTAPEGLRVPTSGFGSVWKGVPDVRETFGFAQTGERHIEMTMQRFEGGSLFLDAESGTVFALMVNGDAYGPY